MAKARDYFDLFNAEWSLGEIYYAKKAVVFVSLRRFYGFA